MLAKTIDENRMKIHEGDYEVASRLLIAQAFSRAIDREFEMLESQQSFRGGIGGGGRQGF